jgi:hypothetical protein
MRRLPAVRSLAVASRALLLDKPALRRVHEQLWASTAGASPGARVTLPDRSQRSRSFRTKAQAVRWEAEQKTALNRGNWVDPSNTTTTTAVAESNSQDLWMKIF